MCDNSSKPIDEFMDPLETLKRALARPALDQFGENAEALGPDARRAAYQLAAALGWCRLLGREIDTNIDGILQWDMAEAAATELTTRAQQWTASARSLEQRWFSTPEPIEADQLCLGLLHLRMKAWAVQVAIDEAYLDSWADQEELPAGRLEAAIGPMHEALKAFDEELRERRNLELLCVASETALLDNWRSLLVAPHADALPWWLDDTLEAVAKEVEEKAIASQPSAATWRRLREAGQREGPRSVDGSSLDTVLAAAVTSHADADAEEVSGVPTGDQELRYAIGRLLLDPLPLPALAAANKPFPISSLPQSESLALEDGGTLYCTVFHNAEGKVVATFRSSSQQLKGRRVLLTATNEEDHQEVLKVPVALVPDEEGVLSGTFDLSVLDLQHRHMIEFTLDTTPD